MGYFATSIPEEVFDLGLVTNLYKIIERIGIGMQVEFFKEKFRAYANLRQII